MSTPSRLRRPTLTTAPLFLLGAIGSIAALSIVLRAAWDPAQVGPAFYVAGSIAVLVAVAGFTAARGCFIDVDPDHDEVRDVVGWVLVRRFRRSDVVQVRVRAGMWRRFELELADERRIVLVGASPAQLPTRLAEGWEQRDLADLALLGSSER